MDDSNETDAKYFIYIIQRHEIDNVIELPKCRYDDIRILFFSS